jgi:hypothetical protein
VDLIVPVAYSLVTTTTPSAPTASWARKNPLRLYAAGSNAARSAGLTLP